MNDTLRMPHEWAKRMGVQIVDLDGWRTEGAPPITKRIAWPEFQERIKHCTVKLLPEFIGWNREEP